MYKSFLHPGFDLEVAVIFGAFFFALWKGDRPEKLGAGLNLTAGVVATGLMILLTDAPPLALLAIDAALSAGFLILAIRYASLWLGAALLLQAVQFSLHAYYFVLGARHDFNYLVVNNIDTAGIDLSIVVGTILAWRRRLRDRREATGRA
ncbi:MAG TPA: hypothetical protein VFC47_16375 [Caulobacteraceae bacterium]|nr:hypothetical protein [Caulobacteraceae bacterium]